jgi:hypothetical protein
MLEERLLEAKVLLLEHDPAQFIALQSFCQRKGLVSLPRGAADALATLEANRDLAGVLLAHDLPGCARDALGLAESIHARRPELPIFLRLPAGQAQAFEPRPGIRIGWDSGDFDALEAAVDRSIFCLRYPAVLVDGIVELTRSSLSGMFPNAVVLAEPPYVVHDRIIHGEVSTLIPIESTWCRGFMMLQTEESALRQGLIQGLSHEGLGASLGFRDLNNLLGEVTNLIWGAFKNRYIPPQAFATQQIQVPLVINHEKKYMSFGSEDPQLCIRYDLSDPSRPGMPHLLIVQRFIFNLCWRPEDLVEYANSANGSVAAGELDLF